MLNNKTVYSVYLGVINWLLMAANDWPREPNESEKAPGENAKYEETKSEFVGPLTSRAKERR